MSSATLDGDRLRRACFAEKANRRRYLVGRRRDQSFHRRRERKGSTVRADLKFVEVHLPILGRRWARRMLRPRDYDSRPSTAARTRS
jgi:hypothetical protein